VAGGGSQPAVLSEGDKREREVRYLDARVQEVQRDTPPDNLPRNPLLLKLTEVPLLLSDVPLSTFVSVGSAECMTPVCVTLRVGYAILPS